MAVSEQARRRLYEALEAQVGEDNAATLMDSLPPAGWGDVATKHDLARLHELTQRDMQVLRAELRAEMAEMKGEMAEMKGELRGEMAELRGEMAELRAGMADLRAELYSSLRAQTITLFSGLVAVAGVVVAAMKL